MSSECTQVTGWERFTGSWVVWEGGSSESTSANVTLGALHQVLRPGSDFRELDPSMVAPNPKNSPLAKLFPRNPKPLSSTSSKASHTTVS